MRISEFHFFNWNLTRKQYLLLLSAFSALICFGALECCELASGDETRVAGIGLELFLEGDYIVPKLNNESFLEYPGMYYYFQCVSFKLFGANDFAAKFPSACAAFGTGLLLFLLGLRLRFKESAAFLSSLLLLSCAQFWSYGKTCTVDMLLAFFILLSVYGFLSFLESSGVRRRSFFLFLYILGLAGGVMTKGMLGFVFPVAVLGSYLVGMDLSRKRFGFLNYVFLGCGLLAGLIPWAFWGVLLYRQEGWDAIHTAFWVNNFGRFSGSQGDHVEPPYYYLLKLPELFQPWLILLPFGLFYAFRGIRREKNSAMLFLVCFLLVPFVMLTISSGKRLLYLLPLYLPAALLSGYFLQRLFQREQVRRAFPYLCLTGAIGFGIAGIVLCVLSSRWGMVYPVLTILLSVAALILRKKKYLPGVLFLFAFACLYGSINSGGFARMNDKKSLRKLFEYVQRMEKEGYRVYLKSPSERTSGAAYFYLLRNLPEKKAAVAENEKELWILRDKRKRYAHAFGDAHYVVSPAEFESVRAKHAADSKKKR